MSLRPPQALAPSRQGESAMNLLEYELMSERADSLGRAGLKVEALISQLQNAEGKKRDVLLFDAAEAVQALFIQREVCGLRNGRDIVARYGIPGDVIARLGVRRPSSDAS
ncbi:DUF6665 family protein [Rhizobium sp. SG_E_25_P2]|uniref:DUF6665 family protein n=1 Tax=Rhizobium sp. SG_E_25_P2 TaxID=2879942 RepID=UPI00247629D1|nr:DUF6665 family protein [Rhizobium sp. SG_E_25_P2]